MPLPIIAAEAMGALGPLLTRLLMWWGMSQAIKVVVKIMAGLGVALATDKFVIQPSLDAAKAAWQGLPADLAMWLGAVGIDKMASILFAAYSIDAMARVFLVKK